MNRHLRLAPALLAAILLLPSARAAGPVRAGEPGLTADPAQGKPAATDVKPADAKVTIPVGGMSCGGCVNTITGKLQQIPGVKAVEVNLEKKRAFVTYDAAKVSAKALVEAIRDAGFEPGVPVAN
jgi:copper chaperone